MSLGQALIKKILVAMSAVDGTGVDFVFSDRLALWVASDNQVAQGVELIDVTSTDKVFAAPGVREIRVTGAGNLALIATNLAGAQAAIIIPVVDGDRISCQWITQVTHTGTTATGLVAYK